MLRGEYWSAWTVLASIASGVAAFLSIIRWSQRYVARRKIGRERTHNLFLPLEPRRIAEKNVSEAPSSDSRITIQEPKTNWREAELGIAMKVVRQRHVRNGRLIASLDELLSKYGRPALEQCADQGNVDALFLLGMKDTGEFGEFTPNIPRSTSYFKRASDLGDPEAMMCFAEAHDGEVLAKDDSYALALMRKSSESNSPQSFLGMAMANEHGRYGLPKNYASAIRLYELAMNAGSGVAAFRLGELLLSGEEKSDRDRGETLVEDANRMGVIDAKIELALKTMSAEPKYIPELKRLIGSTMGGTLSPHGEKLMREVLEDPDSHSYQKWMAENWLRERAASS